VESHLAWSKDVTFKAGKPEEELAFPIIADPDRELVKYFGMIDPEEADPAGGPPMPARALIILFGNIVKLTLLYPATTGRDFDEIKRVLASLQLTQNNGLATPVNWVPGEAVVVTPAFGAKNAGADASTMDGFTAVQLPSTGEGGLRDGKPYLKTISGGAAATLTVPAPAKLEVVAAEGGGENPLKLGATFPNTALKTTTGDIQLFDYLNKEETPWTVFFSHPADFTPVCTTELGMCHNLSGDFKAMGAQLIGVSCDSVESHLAWSKDVTFKAGKPEEELAFPIIADPDRELVTFLGMIDPEEGGDGPPMPARALVILLKGVVKLTIVYPATTGRNFEEIKRVLTSLKLTENNGLATPVNWTPGQQVVVTPAFEKKNDGKDPTTMAGYTAVGLPSTEAGGMREGKFYLRMINDPSA